eukprot:CAMPEP_0172650678 /NCGR_PEP_ID=MMETSP1068-20121228/242417_1 /TAXON_ID=35684 /ORGANISM="Pseudopedinella elastica, Strain CCMP716" /LENGTH=225 /DNA_ID=CAMNT_0013465047 /DNA_START=153 /DNA_END=831 /DNA_ORIENTATION=-
MSETGNSSGNVSFVLMVNKQGQTRLASYNEWMSVAQRVQLEGEIIRRCITRPPEACQILHIRGYCVVYRRYASLFFIVGCLGKSENELETLEFIHCLVETMDRYFESVCELDIMFNRFTLALIATSSGAPPFWSKQWTDTSKGALLLTSFECAFTAPADRFTDVSILFWAPDRSPSVCELDIMFNLEKAHMILDEMVANGVVYDANKSTALQTVALVEKVGKEKD